MHSEFQNMQICVKKYQTDNKDRKWWMHKHDHAVKSQRMQTLVRFSESVMHDQRKKKSFSPLLA